MSLALAVMILLIVVIIAALALFLIATIVQLVKINRGLAVVIGAVGEIVAKTAPVNGVLDAINSNLVLGRNLLEGLFVKKAGDDAGGLVESLFPGEGAKFLQRVGRRGPVVNTGVVYTRGVGILASLGRGAPIGAAHARGPAVRDPKYATTAAAMLYPRPGGARARPKSPVVGKDAPQRYEASESPGVRPTTRQGSPAPAPAPAQEAAPAPAPTGRISLRRREPPSSGPPPAPAPAPEPAAPAPASSGGGGDEAASSGGRLSVRDTKRPWER
ncbi:MAG: hypothetical protein QOJ63_1503 [Solirubrobacteraceae bacterium]|jgi:hypothetical protein|nr:hypothetical protein [Solirubrobacteraceae bacterium]